MSSAAAITSRPEIASPPKLLAKRLQSTVFFGVLTLLLFAPLAFGAVEHWAIFTLEAGSLFLFIGWAFLQTVTGELQLMQSSVFLPIAAFALLVLSQLVFRRTAYQAASISLLLLYGCYGLLCFLMVQSLQRRRNFRILLTGLSGYGFLLATFAFIQGITSNGKLYWIRHPRFGGKIYGPYVNHNHYAGLMELLLPFALVMFLSPGVRPRQKILAAFSGTLMVGTIFTSGSRGGMLACAVQIAFLATVILSRRTTARMALTIGAFLVLAFASLAWLGGDELLQRMLSIPTEMQTELSGGTRLSIDRDCLKMFLQRPLTGWGFGTFPDVYPQFRSFYTDLSIDQAHNDYLQILGETGAVGGLVMIWFLVGAFRTGIRKLQHWPSSSEADVTLAGLVAVTGILIHSFVDFNLQIPANAALFFVLCGVVGMPLHERLRVSRHHDTLS